MGMPKTIQAKDIDERPILEFLFERRQRLGKYYDWSCWYHPEFDALFPKDVPYKVRRAKLKSMIDRGLIDGCTCGCRGDFMIDQRGIEALGKC